MTLASVVIPAHDEEAVIERCLRTLLEGAEPGSLEVIVVANGCTDGTAELARRVGPPVTVLELAEPSKVAALNAGDDAATAFPRVYLDADVELPFASLQTVVDALGRGDLDCAAPTCEFVVEDRPWFVRRFYDAWSALPYVSDELVGNGVYALSEAGRNRFGRFPDITADDLFVRNLFAGHERSAVAGTSFRVHTPRTLGGLLAVRERTYRGNAELAERFPDAVDEPTRSLAAMGRVGRTAPTALAVYLAVNALARVRLRGRRRPQRWERDDSARTLAPSGGTDRSVAYLTSRYPATSHTFVLREVLCLRRSGWQIDTYSVRAVDPTELLWSEERQEARRTRALLPTTLGRVLRSQVAALSASPAGWCSTLRSALGHGGNDPRRVLWQVFYFAEAVLAWHAMRGRPARHVHTHFANVAADVARLVTRLGRRLDREDWTWSFTMHGPRELADVEAFDLPAKVRDASRVVCISDFCRSQLMALVPPDHWSKLAVVHCGVDVEAFALRERTDPVDRPLEILCVGRLVPEKGQSLLVDALALLRERGIAARLTLAGGGQDRSTVEAAVERHRLAGQVEVAGPVSQDRIDELYARADVFALPSFAEGVPVVLMEAMATGLPVVTTRIAGIPELVADGVSGALVPPGRADALADALAELAADGDLRRSMGRAGRRRVEEAFEVSTCAAQLGEVFAEVLAVEHR